MTKFSLLTIAATLGLASSLALTTQGAPAQSAGDATRGKALFFAKGCYECHGTVGQGNFGAGPPIAPNPVPFDALLAYVRAPKQDMPPYDEHILSESDARAIDAYLESIPAGKPATDIAALRDVDLGNAGPAHPLSPQLERGQAIFNAECIKCHVYAQIGPSLAGVKSTLGLGGTMAVVKNPAPPMPKLYPAKLNDDDVAAVAAYVQTL